MENKKIQNNEQLALNAVKKVYISNLDIDGGKPASNGNAKILLDCEELIVKDSEIKSTCVAYNIFEQRGTVKYNLKNVKVERLTCDDVNLKHNALSLYNFADDATILIQDSSFNFDVDNSNVIRLANYKNAENVTVHFKNVEWTYENGAGTDFDWGGILIFQPSAGDVALSGDMSKVQTWKFIFEDCKYNGVKITENNTGEHSQAMYVYNVGGAGKCESPDTYELDVEFI